MSQSVAAVGSALGLPGPSGFFCQDAPAFEEVDARANERRLRVRTTLRLPLLLRFSELAAKAMLEAADPRSSQFRTMRHQDIKPEHLLGRRREALVLAVLGHLRASANWHRIAREWMYGEGPVTELGRQEAEFFAGPHQIAGTDEQQKQSITAIL